MQVGGSILLIVLGTLSLLLVLYFMYVLLLNPYGRRKKSGHHRHTEMAPLGSLSDMHSHTHHRHYPDRHYAEHYHGETRHHLRKAHDKLHDLHDSHARTQENIQSAINSNTEANQNIQDSHRLALETRDLLTAASTAEGRLDQSRNR